MSGDPVLKHVKKLQSLAAQRTMLAEKQAERETNGQCLREMDSAFVDHSEKWHPAMRNLADTPSNSLEGITAKLRILAMSMMNQQGAEYREDILLLAIADLERLSSAPA